MAGVAACPKGFAPPNVEVLAPNAENPVDAVAGV